MSKPIQSQVKHKLSVITSLHNAYQEIFSLKKAVYIYDDWLMELDWIFDVDILFSRNLIINWDVWMGMA
jgi:hypothetical protein